MQVCEGLWAKLGGRDESDTVPSDILPVCGGIFQGTLSHANRQWQPLSSHYDNTS